MELHVDTEKLARRIADALRDHNEQFLSDLAARFAQEFRTTGSSGTEMIRDTEIMGIVPHKLYPVSFVADRWNVSADNVRKKSEEELPRSGWKGGEIRYRGTDILRYEGVDVEEHLDGTSPELDEKNQFPEQRQPKGHSRRAGEENGDGRPYESGLPALSDEPTSTD